MINKSKNVNLQLTISKDAYKQLLKIKEDIKSKTAFNLSKSQLIEFLINKYNGETPTMNSDQINKDKARNETKELIETIKKSLNISYPKIAELSGIPLTTLKRYAYGEQEPSESNRQKLEELIKKYDIKL